MIELIDSLNELFIDFKIKHLKIVACCCGHQKYPITILVKNNSMPNSKVNGNMIYDFCTGIEIPRVKKFYKRDKQGYYYIPEVLI